MIERVGRVAVPTERQSDAELSAPPEQGWMPRHGGDHFERIRPRSLNRSAPVGGGSSGSAGGFWRRLLEALFGTHSSSDAVSAAPAPSSTPVVAPSPSPRGDSIAAEDANFLTQLAGSSWNISGGGVYDCGPTSALMVLSSLGLASHPDPESAGSAIRQFRGVVDEYEGLGANAGGDDTIGVSVYGLEGAIQSRGAVTAEIPVDESDPASALGAIDGQLARGAKVIAYGDPSAAWEPQLVGNYQELGSFGHFVAVLGRADDGNYLVGDPLSTNGVIEATPKQLAAYIQGGLQLDPPFGGAFAVSRQAA